MIKSTLLKSLAALAAGVLVLSCTKTKVTELSLSTLTANFEAAGALEQTITVTSNDLWTASCPDNWVTLSPESGEGDGSIKITVTENTGFEPRSSTVTVTAGDKTSSVKVNQLALTPSLDVQPLSFEVKSEGGTCEVTVTSNSTWTVTVPAADPAWILADKTSGEGNSTVILTVLQNLDRETRSATVTIKETVGGATMEVAVSQEMAPVSRRSDSLALVAIYNAIGSTESWNPDRLWDLNKPMSDWYGIKLNDEGRVINLKFLKATVKEDWTIPDAISELTELTDLRFIDCKVTGTMPEGIYDLTKLVSLYLTNNTVAWSLSPRIAGMTNLKDLYIDQNPNITGTIPTEVGQLKKLVNFNVSQTGITGAIPAEMSGCDALVNLMAFKTNITGIPDNFDKWGSLKLVQVYGNKGLTGPLPASLGHGAKLTSIWMYECNFEGNIPESWSNLPSTCTQIRIQDNKLSGVIPAAVRAHANWSRWTADKYILKQQEGYGLTLE